MQWRWFHCITWYVFIKGHSYNLCLHNVDYYYGPTIHHVVRNKQRSVWKLCILKRNNFWNVSKWLGGAYKSASSHLDHLQNPVLIRDDKTKWLDLGITPDPENLQPHAGFVGVKSGYSETIVWCKVRLTKQRNVHLTTDGLWAMPLNTAGCCPTLPPPPPRQPILLDPPPPPRPPLAPPSPP